MKLPYNEYNEFNYGQMQGQLRRALIVNMLQHIHWNGRQTGQSILQSDSSTRGWRRFDSPVAMEAPTDCVQKTAQHGAQKKRPHRHQREDIESMSHRERAHENVRVETIRVQKLNLINRIYESPSHF